MVDGNKWHYTIIENSVIESESLDIYEKMLYIALKRFANLHTQEAFPGVKKLAIYAGMSERKARSVLSDLESKNMIAIERRTNDTSIYTILPSHAHGAGGHAHGAVGVMHTVQGGHAHGADELKRTELKKDELKKVKDIEQVAKATDTNAVKKNESDFDELWKLYPNKKGKAAALKAYKKAIKKGVTHETIERGLINFKAHCELNSWYSPAHGSTWFNGERWSDEYENTGGATSGRNEANWRSDKPNDAVQSEIDATNERRKRLLGIEPD